MAVKTLGKNKKNFILIFFGMLALFSAFGIVKQTVPQAKAAGCEMDCFKKSDNSCTYNYNFNSFGGDDWACVIGDTPQGSTGTEQSCTDTATACNFNSCPTAYNTQNRAVCAIADSYATVLGCNYRWNANGLWDASDSKCIKCDANNKETNYYDITSSVPHALSTNSGDEKCDSACGASAACDEQTPGGGVCDSDCNPIGASCTASAPSINVSPSSYTGPAGIQTFTISATRNDSSGCNTASIPLNVSCTAGITPSWTSGLTPAAAYNGTGTQTVDADITASGSCTMTAESPDDNTKTASKTVTINVSNCPAGYSVTFGGTKKFSKNDNFLINYGSSGNFCTLISRVTGGQHDFWSEDTTSGFTSRSNYNTGIAGSTYVLTGDTVRATINNASACDYNSSCKDEIQIVECTKNSDCVSNNCNLSTNTCTGGGCTTGTCNGGQWCPAAGGPWQNCSVGNTCSPATGLCVPAGPPTITVSGCSAGCNPAFGGTCNAMIGNALWVAPGPTAGSCATDSQIASMCAAEGAFAPTCSITASNGTTCGCGGGGTTVNFGSNCYQLTGPSVAASASYSGAATGPNDTIILYKPNGSISSCMQVTGASGTSNYNLDNTGTWTVKIHTGNSCVTPGAVKATATTAVQSTPCGGPPPPPPLCSGPGMYRSPLSYCTIQELIAAATNWILGLVSSIIILILVIGGIMYVTSAGDEERIKSAKNIILYAVIGLAIVLLAYSLITEVKSILKIS